MGQGWESALAALQRGTRAAADEGAPDLHMTLFPPVVRAVTKPKPAEETKKEPTEEPKPAAAPTSTAA